ncbi:MAG: fasciclin domain-containing protein [Porphyromonadaceae bacterium]|nr:fasciclin domain-containing protein [Porphyromonadaceae bacterium]
MRKGTNLLASAFLILFAFSSCNEMDKYYDNDKHSTSVSVGNGWDYLNSKGNFTNFLAAVDQAGYTDLVKGKGLATIFAPDDEAFEAYFARHGYSSLSDMPAEEVSNMITYHLLYYNFNGERFMTYKPTGTSTTDNYVGLYFQYRTKSRDANEEVYDPGDGTDHLVFHYEKNVPVFTPNLFNFYGSTGRQNYDYFYGDGLWEGDNYVEGDDPYFRVSNAGVKEYDIITDNGYIFVLDDVVEPLKTIYQTMSENPDYSQFTAAYDRFKALYYDEDISQDYGYGDSLYIYQHSGLFSIASEWPLAVSETLLGPLAYGSLTVFAPSDQAINEFFNRYWAEYYDDFASVNFNPLYTFMGEQLAIHRLNGQIGPCLPSEVDAGNVVTAVSATAVDVTSSEVTDPAFCSNGIFYGVQKVCEPKYFSYVTAPAFINPDYNMFLILMQRAGVLDLYTADNQYFYAFYPTDEILQNTAVGGGVEETMEYVNPQPNRYGYEDVVYVDGDETPSVNGGKAKRIVQSQFCDKVIELSTGEKIYHSTYGSYNYIYQNAGDSLFSSQLYYEHYGKVYPDDNNMIKAEPITNISVKNGEAYALVGESNASALMPVEDDFESLSVKTSTYLPWELTETTYGARNFYVSGLNAFIDENTYESTIFTTMKEVGGSGATPQYIVFALTNNAVMNAWDDGIIATGTGARKTNRMDRYLPNVFVPVEENMLTGYPFPQDGEHYGALKTFKITADGQRSSIILDTSSYPMTVTTDQMDHTVPVVNAFPYIFSDCAIYIIDEYLDFGEDFNVGE